MKLTQDQMVALVGLAKTQPEEAIRRCVELCNDNLTFEVLERGGLAVIQVNKDPYASPRTKFVNPELYPDFVYIDGKADADMAPQALMLAASQERSREFLVVEPGKSEMKDDKPIDGQQNQVDLVREHCGNWNTDIAAGWEAGLLGKERIGRKLYNRSPPAHYFEPKNQQRYLDWLFGRGKALEYRRQEKQNKTIYFAGYTKEGQLISISRKGWNAARGPIVTRMARMGVAGDVTVNYCVHDGAKSTIKRTVKCGI